MDIRGMSGADFIEDDPSRCRQNRSCWQVKSANAIFGPYFRLFPAAWVRVLNVGLKR